MLSRRHARNDKLLRNFERSRKAISQENAPQIYYHWRFQLKRH